MNDQSSPMVLQAGYELHWYRVESVLGKGAFGITYLAHDVNLDRQVAIKEYLPGQFSTRNTDLTVHPTTDAHKEDFEWGLKRFISEAKILTKFEHPNLVRVFNVFEMNNTAYMVMNYEVGKSLQQILKSRKTLNETELMKIIIPLLDGLEVMHEKGFVHRDIKPGNIFIRSDGSPVLLDFGSARQTRAERGKEMSEVQQTVTTLVSPGYAPIEQYSSNSNRQGPWTDIYGLGATLYKAVTGKMPLAAVDRSETIVHDNKDCYQPVSNLGEGRYTEKFLAAIDHAMAFKADERPQDVVEWRTEFGILEDDIPTMPVSNFQAISGSVATVKLDQTQNAVTIKIASGLEEETEKIDSAAITGVPKPIYLQTKWLASAAIVVIFIAFGIIKLSGEKEDKITPLVQVLPESEQVVVEEASATEEPAGLTLEEQTKIEELLILAEEDITALRLTSPNENNALNKYLSILMIDENNTEANEGIRLVSDKYISLAYGAMQSNNLAKADKYIEKAKRIYSESDKISPARSTLQAKYSEQKITETEPEAEKLADKTEQISDTEEEESGGFWDSIKKWNEENKNVEQEESAIDKNIKKHFDL
ncbi:MAG: serine/threonine protein kinase [Proteobacteria bacterium]|nr:serine/threonine protein kinase [Pseudomonadota bacterium]